jgi:hypothetical protein
MACGLADRFKPEAREKRQGSKRPLRLAVA